MHSRKSGTVTWSTAARAAALGLAFVVAWACSGPSQTSVPPSAEGAPKHIEREFLEACQRYFDLPPISPSVKHVVIGRNGWILLKSELEYLVDSKPRILLGADGKEALPRGAVAPSTAILYFKRGLEEMGISLIVVPIPVRTLVYPESVLDSPRLADALGQNCLSRKQRDFFDRLESNDCEAVDLTPIFIDQRSSARRPVFIPTESHWTGFGVYVAGGAIAEKIKKMDWYGGLEKRSIHHEWLTINHTGDLIKRIQDGLEDAEITSPALKNLELEAIEMDVRKVTFSGETGSMAIAQRNPESPVVIIGDSYTEFGSAQGFGIAHQLAFELGFPVDVLTTKGGGANAARMNLMRAASSNPTYLTGKKCVIWCFASRDMVGEQWFVTPFRR